MTFKHDQFNFKDHVWDKVAGKGRPDMECEVLNNFLV